MQDSHNTDTKRMEASQVRPPDWQEAVLSRFVTGTGIATDEDLYSIYNYSLWLDIKILFKTLIAVLQGKGAF